MATRKRLPRGSRPPSPMPPVLRAGSRDVTFVDAPERTVIAYEGRGPLEDGELPHAIELLQGVAYALRRQRRGAADFSIGPAEALWWADGDDSRRWRLRLAVPEDVTEEMLAATVLAAVVTKRGRLAGERDARWVTLERVPPQRLARLTRLGPEADDAATLARLRAAIVGQGLSAAPGHLEVYLSDPRRVAPSRRRTVLLVEARAPDAARGLQPR
jgi:hypothetical protein